MPQKSIGPIMPHASRASLVGLGFVFLWFLIGGIAHFAATDLEMRIVPPYVPAPRLTVLVTGVFELLGAAGLLLQATRRAAGWGLFALTIAVTPANVYMLQHAPAGAGRAACIDRLEHAAWSRARIHVPLLKKSEIQ